MPDPEADTYEQARASELRKVAYLCGEFRDALIAVRMPTELANQLVATWFEDELASWPVADAEDD